MRAAPERRAVSQSHDIYELACERFTKPIASEAEVNACFDLTNSPIRGAEEPAACSEADAPDDS